MPLNEKTKTQGVAVRRRTLIQRAVELLVSLAFLALALRGISFADLGAALSGANYIWLIPAVALTVFILLIKGWRWQLLFYPEHHLPFGPVFSALCVGYLASNVLPARLGEVARLFVLSGDQPVSPARTLSTIVVERLLDLLTLLAIMVALLPFVQLPEWMTRSAQGLGILALLAAAGLVLLSFWKERLLAWAHWIGARVRFLDRPGVYAALAHLVDGFAALRGRLGIALIALSFAGWAGVIGVGWSAAQAFRLDIPLTAVIFAVVVTTLGMLVPSSPGYIGVFHYLVTVALAPFDVPKDLALSYALVWHAANYLTLTVAGVLAMWVHGISIRQLWQWRRPEMVEDP